MKYPIFFLFALISITLTIQSMQPNVSALKAEENKAIKENMQIIKACEEKKWKMGATKEDQKKLKKALLKRKNECQNKVNQLLPQVSLIIKNTDELNQTYDLYKKKIWLQCYNENQNDVKAQIKKNFYDLMKIRKNLLDGFPDAMQTDFNKKLVFNEFLLNNQ